MFRRIFEEKKNKNKTTLNHDVIGGDRVEVRRYQTTVRHYSLAFIKSSQIVKYELNGPPHTSHLDFF